MALKAFHVLRTRWVVRSLALLISAALVAAGGAVYAGDSNVVKIEEDWELVLGDPDTDLNAPQITCSFSPVGNADSLYAAFELNHHSQPAYSVGGLQIQVWSNEVPLLNKKHPSSAVLQFQGETVRWTQRMQLSDGVLTFEVVNGTSSTWGAFGGAGQLKVAVATTLANLNGYNPAVSASNSGIGYASNRVSSLVLKKVRAFTSDDDDGVEDATPRVVHPKP